MAVKQPSGAVEGLAIARGSGNRKLTATWKVPDSLSKGTKKADPAAQLNVAWYLGVPGNDPKRSEKIKKLTDKDSVVDLASVKFGTTTYTRNSFYPKTSTKLVYVSCSVRAKNKGGYSKKTASVTYNFKVPEQPTIGAFSFAETGVVSVAITAAADSGQAERYDTEYYWVVTRSDTRETYVSAHTASTNGTINLSYNASVYQGLPRGAYIQCHVKARSRGYAGDSAWVEKYFYISYPKVPTITSVNCPAITATSRVTCGVRTNRDTQHPVTGVRLEALANVPYSAREEVEAASDRWDEVGAADDGTCAALACLVGDLMPDEGMHSWLRVKVWYQVEDVLVAYSAPAEVEALYVPAATATTDSVAIIGHESGEDGTTVLVTLAWAPTGSTDTSTGTELSWSDQLDTWRSTDDPSTYDVTYDDGPVTHEGTSYQSSATIAIKGLDEGTTTYVRARRYKETDSGVTYGPYGNTEVVIPSVAPASVVLDAPAYVPEGQGVTCTWTFSGGSAQTAWQLLLSDGTVVAEGTDAMGAATIPADRAAAVATNGSISVRVAVSTGGAWVTSTPMVVNIVQRPTLSVAPSATYDAQPVGIPFACATPDASIAVIVTAMGTDGDTPAGMVAQPEGDVVWSGVVLPEWSGGSATVQLPEGLAFVDGARYRVTATATDPATGLASSTVGAEFGVAWAHQAPDPDGCVTLTPIDITDVDGANTKAVRIDLVPPAGSVATDCYDIYRLTDDGAQLIGQSWPLESTATDDYAPYGTDMDLEYRVACRTADGDVAWVDVPYQMGGSAIRIDWAGGSVELPYDIAISDGYGKDVDLHEYLDGSTDAFYSQGVRRSAKLATNVLRLEDADTISAVKELARFVGPAFVRTPDGSAYEADVQVSDMTPTYELSAVSITATEVALTAAYVLPPYDVTDETEA